jgi:hypothetical protein
MTTKIHLALMMSTVPEQDVHTGQHFAPEGPLEGHETRGRADFHDFASSRRPRLFRIAQLLTDDQGWPRTSRRAR